jgi:N-acetyl-anhydromuramyl-L-alanine amidase AmpD
MAQTAWQINFVTFLLEVLQLFPSGNSISNLRRDREASNHCLITDTKEIQSLSNFQQRTKYT